MPSRKRNKGKERRAKREEAKGAWWRGLAIGGCCESEASCGHGCIAIPSPGHAVSVFMNTYNTAHDGAISFFTGLENTFKCDVWNSAQHRQMAIDILLSMGTNIILTGNGNGGGCLVEGRGIALAILLLDCYDGESSFEHLQDVTRMKLLRSMPRGCNEREVLKFFSKRLTCSCLKEKYKEARKILPKFGKCWHCEKMKDRSSLATCGRCKVHTYCSRECQVAHWPHHEESCDVYVDIRQHQA